METEPKIPESIKLRVYYRPNGTIESILVDDIPPGSGAHCYGNHNLDQLFKENNPKSPLEYFMKMLHRNARILAFGAEEAELTWSTNRYRYRKVKDEIFPVVRKDIIAQRNMQYSLLNLCGYEQPVMGPL